MATPAPPVVSSLTCIAIRLVPGQEIISEIVAAVQGAQFRAAFLMTCVGSCTAATIRMASATAAEPNEIIKLAQCMEIVSLVGTISPDGPHIHVALADATGRVVGGHAMALTVFTTAEIVIGECAALSFARPFDARTGFDELTATPRHC